MNFQEHTDDAGRLNGAATAKEQKRDASQATQREVGVIGAVLDKYCTETFPNGPDKRAVAVYAKGHDDDTATNIVLSHSRLRYSEGEKDQRRPKVRSRLVTMRNRGWGLLPSAKKPSKSRARWDRLNQKMTKQGEQIDELEHMRSNDAARIAALETAVVKDHKRTVDVYYALNKLAAEFKALQTALGDDPAINDIPA